VEANSTGGQGSRRAVAPSDDDDDDMTIHISIYFEPFLSINCKTWTMKIIYTLIPLIAYTKKL
jgi:hypothetical protein